MRCLFPLGLPCHTSGVCLVQWQLSFGLAVIHQNTSKPFKGNGPKALQQGSPTERLLFSMFLKYRFYIHFPVSLLLSDAVFLFGNSFNIPTNLSFPNAHVQHEIFQCAFSSESYTVWTESHIHCRWNRDQLQIQRCNEHHSFIYKDHFAALVYS